jgi:hypothetical protein
LDSKGRLMRFLEHLIPRRRTTGVARTVFRRSVVLLTGLTVSASLWATGSSASGSVSPSSLKSVTANQGVNVLAFAPMQDGRLWAGNGAYIATSDDEGQRWSTVTPPNVADDDAVERVSGFSSFGDHLWFAMTAARGAGVDGQRGFAVDYSPDGGRTWSATSISDCGSCSMTFSFIGPRDGWMLSTSGQLYRTMNGVRWRLIARLPTLLSSSPYEAEAASGVTFTSTSDGWLASGGKLYRSVNSGLSWTPVQLPQGSPEELGPPVFFTSAEGAVAVGVRGGRRYIDETTNGGGTWSTYSLPLALADSSNLVPRPIPSPNFSSASVGSMYSQSEIYLTSDGGIKWYRVAPPHVHIGLETQLSISGFAMVTATQGWVIFNLSVPSSRFGACTVRNKRACAISTLFMSTSNAGKSWQRVEMTGVRN